MTAPHPFHLLLAWPDRAGHMLWRSLRAWRSALEVTLVPPGKVASYLRTKGYYHALYLAPADWRRLTSDARIRLSGAVALVVFGPEPPEAGDLVDLSSCLYLPAAESLDQIIALFTTVHQALSEGQSLVDCVAASGGRLALIGGEPAWSLPPIARPAGSTAQAGPGGSRQVNAVDAQGGAAAIGPGARAINVAAGGTYVEQQTTTSVAGIAIGSIVVKGDLVAGAKVVQHAEGDQVNVNRGMPAAGKLEQSAGGDQVNVNRAGGAPAVKPCAQCGRSAKPGDRFCQDCGAPL